jgi:hypothetical protein
MGVASIFVGFNFVGVGDARAEAGAYGARPANEAAVARLLEGERVRTPGARPVMTLRTRAEAVAALDERLGFDGGDDGRPHAVSALYTAEGHVSHLFAGRREGLVEAEEGRAPEVVVEQFIRQNPALWDLQTLDLDALDLESLLPAPEVTTGPMPNVESYTTLRYEQTWRGHALADGVLVAHLLDGHRLMAMSGMVINHADVYFEPEPALDESEAEALAVAFAAEAMPTRNELTALVRDRVGFAGERRLVYRIDVTNETGTLLFDTWVDAHSGELVRQSAQWGEYQPVPSTYNVFHPLTTDPGWEGATPANSMMKSGAYSSLHPTTNAYYHFDSGAAMRSPIKVYNEAAGYTPVWWDPNNTTVWDDPPGSEVVGWYNRKFNASHVSYWSQIFRDYMDETMELGDAFEPPNGYGPWTSWTIIAGAYTDPGEEEEPPAEARWGCNFPAPKRNYTGQLADPADEAGRVCINLPNVGNSQGESAAGANNGAYSARVLWHEMGHGVDFIYGSGVMRQTAEPGISGAGGFHEPIAAVLQLVTVARHFPTTYSFNDYDTANGRLMAQVGKSANTLVDLSSGTRKCYPIVGAGEAYSYGHPLYQAVWESARGQHCHSGACTYLNDGATTADAMKAAYWALRLCPSGPSSTLSEFANWFVSYYAWFGTSTQFENRARIFARHDMTTFYQGVVCDGNAVP